jgi:sortase A
MPMRRTLALLWIERALLTLGIALGAWCAIVFVEARYTRSLPPVKVTMTLPGDDVGRGSAAPPPSRSAPPVGSVVGRLAIPSLGLTTTVLEGTDDQTLRRGSGHIEDTPFPGETGNVGIAGHRDTVFRPLKRVKVGDALDLTTADRVYHYRITNAFIVNPQDVYVLDPTDKPTLTLVTCYPFEFVGHAPRRFIVQGVLEGTDGPSQSSGSGRF